MTAKWIRDSEDRGEATETKSRLPSQEDLALNLGFSTFFSFSLFFKFYLFERDRTERARVGEEQRPRGRESRK